jgi:hypothetical protein
MNPALCPKITSCHEIYNKESLKNFLHKGKEKKQNELG